MIKWDLVSFPKSKQKEFLVALALAPSNPRPASAAPLPPNPPKPLFREGHKREAYFEVADSVKRSFRLSPLLVPRHGKVGTPGPRTRALGPAYEGEVRCALPTEPPYPESGRKRSTFEPAGFKILASI